MPPSVSDPPAVQHPLDHEARLLAQLLQSARVVLVLGGSEADRATLLAQRLPTQLAAAGGAGCLAYLAQWPDDPTSGLLQALRQALPADAAVAATAADRGLAGALQAWGAQHRTRFVVSLDGLDRLPPPLTSGTTAPAFLVELAECINRRDVPASFVLAMDEGANATLATLRHLVPDLEDMSLRLRPTQTDVAAAGDASSSQKVAAAAGNPVAREAKHTTERPVIRSGDVYALINDALSRVATGAAANPLLQRRADAPGEPLVETFVPPPADPPPPAVQADLHDAQAARPRAGKSLWRRLIDRLGSRAP